MKMHVIYDNLMVTQQKRMYNVPKKATRLRYTAQM